MPWLFFAFWSGWYWRGVCESIRQENSFFDASKMADESEFPPSNVVQFPQRGRQ